MKAPSSKAAFFLVGAICAVLFLFLLAAGAPKGVAPRYEVEVDEDNPSYLRLAITDHAEQKLYLYYALMQSTGQPKTIKLRSTIDLTSAGDPQLHFDLHEESDDAPDSHEE